MENLKGRAGIYIIKNLVNKKIYVGSSVCLDRRKSNHFTLLRNNKHYNSYLQRTYNKYGEINLKFEILEFIEKSADKKMLKDNILSREQYWIDKLRSFDKNIGYNLTLKADSILGYKKTPEQIKNVSNAKKGIRPSKETRKKMSIAKLGSKSPTYGKTYGDVYTAQAIINLDTGKIYDSLKRAADEYGMRNTSNISSVCRGFSETAGGFRWAYLDDKNNILYTNFKPKHMRKIININTNEIFDSIVLAAEKYKVSPSAIRSALTGRSKTCCGCKWKYDNNEVGRSKFTSVVNICHQKVFKSMNDAARFYNINSKGISYACKRKNNIYGGYHWQYYEDHLKDQEKEK